MAYDPNQPRKPAGDPHGGEWTDGDSGNAIKKAAGDLGSAKKYLQGTKKGTPIELTKPVKVIMEQGGAKTLPAGTVLKALPGGVMAYDASGKPIGLLSTVNNFDNIEHFKLK